MKTIETRITIAEDRKLTMQLPQGLEPGDYCAVIVLEKTIPMSIEANQPANVAHDCGTHPEDL